VVEPGVYTLGLYDSLEDNHSEHLFPLPVLKRSQLLNR
jgi:hypothetical protein